MSPNWPVSLVKTAEAGGRRDRSEQPVGTAVDFLRDKVPLRGMRPPIRRRLEVPARITLAGLPAVLQAAFGWTDGHLHGFEVKASGRRPRLNRGPGPEPDPARVAYRHRRRPAGLPVRLWRRPTHLRGRRRARALLSRRAFGRVVKHDAVGSRRCRLAQRACGRHLASGEVEQPDHVLPVAVQRLQRLAVTPPVREHPRQLAPGEDRLP
jgi:hypothetical protein